MENSHAMSLPDYGSKCFANCYYRGSYCQGCQSPSLEDMHNDSDALVSIHQAITFDVFNSILMCKTTHEAWTKLDGVYGGSYLEEANIFPMETIGEVSTTSYHEEHPIAATSNYLDTSTSSTLPTFSVSQGNGMV